MIIYDIIVLLALQELRIQICKFAGKWSDFKNVYSCFFRTFISGKEMFFSVRNIFYRYISYVSF